MPQQLLAWTGRAFSFRHPSCLTQQINTMHLAMCLKKLLLLFSKKITVFSANWCSAILLPLLSVFKKLPVWFLQLARHKFSQRLRPIQEEAEPLLIQYWSVISGLLIDAINIRLELKIELILMSERFLVISSWGKQESLGFWIKQKKFYALINQRCPVQTLWKQTKSRKHLVWKCKIPWNINTWVQAPASLWTGLEQKISWCCIFWMHSFCPCLTTPPISSSISAQWLLS